MEDAWIVVPRSVSFDDLMTALAPLGDRATLSAGPSSTQIHLTSGGTAASRARIEAETPEVVDELQPDERARAAVRAVAAEPAFYGLRYRSPALAATVLGAIVAGLAPAVPVLVMAGSTQFWPGDEFLR